MYLHLMKYILIPQQFIKYGFYCSLETIITDQNCISVWRKEVQILMNEKLVTTKETKNMSHEKEPTRQI
jgi:hypothetical protein